MSRSQTSTAAVDGMFAAIEAALLNGHGDGYAVPQVTYVGDRAETPSVPTTELALAAVTGAVQGAQAFSRLHFGAAYPAVIYRDLIDAWCTSSFLPQGWQLPKKRSDFSRDFKTKDGWIRLHGNYPHLRAVSQRIIGSPDGTVEDAEKKIATWNSAELQDAIVAAGGVAAAWYPTEKWLTQPQAQAVAAEPIVHWSERPATGPVWKPTDPSRPLRGLKVLDLTRVLAGPNSTRFLSSLGASVLRIDPDGWEEEFNELEMTVGKHCAGLDLKSEGGRARLLELAREAHVFVNGYRADALEGLGLGEDALRAVNPNLTIVYLNAFGWTGPWRNRRGFDSLVQSNTGLAGTDASGMPRSLPFQVLDYSAGFMVAAAAMYGLLRIGSHGLISTARVSLARQAQVWIDHHLNTKATPTVPATAAQKSRPNSFEDTSWGPMERLPLPYEIAGARIGWRLPARRLRADPVAWPDDGF